MSVRRPNQWSPKGRFDGAHPKSSASRKTAPSVRASGETSGEASSGQSAVPSAGKRKKPAGRGAAGAGTHFWKRSRIFLPPRKKTADPSAAKTGENPEKGNGVFQTDWAAVINGTDRTRRFSLRLVAVLSSVMLAVVIVSNPLRSYISQQEEKRSLAAALESGKERLSRLKQEEKLWKDPDFVRAQARRRLGYVLPGQTLYLVDGEALKGKESKYFRQVRRINEERRAATPFYLTVWEALTLSGKTKVGENPQRTPLIRQKRPAKEPKRALPADKARQTSDKTPKK